MILTDDEKRMLDGDYGPGVQKSMKLLVQWGELFDAERMVKVNGVHMSCNLPTGAVMELSEGTDTVRTLSTLHAVYDPKYWREKFEIVLKTLGGGYGTADEGEFETRMGLFRKLSFLPTFTCSPYTIGILPRPGDVLCMTGSSGQVISNSFFGARAGRESVTTCFAAAITGKTPLMGLIKKENRYAEVLVKIGKDIDPSRFTDADYGALGYHIGEVTGPRNVAIEDLPNDMSFEHERMLVSPLPVSGACVLCHVIGVSPEANTLEEVLGGKRPDVIEVGKREIAESYEKLNDAKSNELDMVAFGCPHLTITEVGELASLLEGKKVSQDVTLMVGISRPTYVLAKDCGYAEVLEMAGAIIVNSCVGPLNTFIYLEDGAARVAATNSARAAHYIQRMSGGKTKTFYGDSKKCIQAAIKGRWEE